MKLVVLENGGAPAPVKSRQLDGQLVRRQGITIARAAEILRVRVQGKKG